jgi:hypothetical protein
MWNRRSPRAVESRAYAPRMIDQRIAKWTGWIEGPIKDDVVSMHLRRYAWHRLGEIISDHGSLPDSYFWHYLTQAVPDPDSRNLGQLLFEVAHDPDGLTRDFRFGLQGTTDESDRLLDERIWTEEYGREVGDHLDPAIPKADLERLRLAAAEVKRYVDENVAHSDKSPAEVVVTIDDMHAAIDAIGEPFRRCAVLLTGADWPNLTPVIQDEWEAIFREPWVRS